MGRALSMGGVLTSCVSALRLGPQLSPCTDWAPGSPPALPRSPWSPDFAHRECSENGTSSLALGQRWGRRRGHWPSKLRSGARDRGTSRDADLWPRGQRQRSEVRLRTMPLDEQPPPSPWPCAAPTAWPSRATTSDSWVGRVSLAQLWKVLCLSLGALCQWQAEAGP